MANQVAKSVPFGDLCLVLEQITKKSKQEKQKCLSNFVNDFKIKVASIAGDKDSSFFPILRLLVPSLDRERSAYNLKESKLGALLVKVLSIKKDTNDGKKLLNYRSVNSTQSGDFASVASSVLKNRMNQTSSKITIGDMNYILDKVSHLDTDNKGQMLDDIFSHAMRNLTADHFKWFLRIILKDLKLGIGPNTILSCYHPDAPEFYNVCQKLSKVCDEFEDGNVRPLEMGVQMFFAISPMLSERLDITDVASLPISHYQPYFVEEKYDGERFQMHMQNGVFEYFSRNGHQFTSTYGKTYDSGMLTPNLKNCFSAAVTSFILDGEMMGWHKEKQFLSSKAMAFDVKKITERSQFQPCFCAFDLLYYNGKSLVGPPGKGGLKLAERLNMLKNLFVCDVPGVIFRSKNETIEDSSNILIALNKAIEDLKEGIVVKNIDSYYIPNKRNAGWYKIKPEYTEGATDDLDMVIIGADEAENKKQGRANSFMLAVSDSTGGGAEPHRWLCVGRVASGLSYDERDRISTHLEKYWKKSRNHPAPNSLVFNKIKSDFWILPEHSIVLQVRATELVRCTDFATTHTLRFPRVVKIREDKPVKDIMTLDEFNKLVGHKGSVIKMATKHINEDQIAGASPKIPKKKSTNSVQVASEFKKVSLTDVNVTSSALQGRKICIISDDEDCNREALVRILKSHGGIDVTNYGPDTWCCVVGKLTFRARGIIDSRECDVTTTAWLRSLPNSTTPCAIRPLDLISMKRDTRIGFAREYDAFGDSYTELIDEDTLKRCFVKMDENEPQIYLTNKEMIDLDNELFSGCNPHSFLRPCLMYIHSSVLAVQAMMYGATLCDAHNVDMTHVVVARNGHVEKLPDRCGATIVTEDWLEKCIMERRLVEEADFLV